MRLKTHLHSGGPARPVERPHPDTLHGRYLCERCEEVMTDTIVPATESPTGEEMALCVLCQAKAKVIHGHSH